MENIRVSYAAGRKMSDDEYGSFDFHVSMSADVPEREAGGPGKTIAAMSRAVERVLEAKVKQFEKRGSLPYDNRPKYGRDDYDPSLEGD